MKYYKILQELNLSYCQINTLEKLKMPSKKYLTFNMFLTPDVDDHIKNMEMQSSGIIYPAS